MRVEPLTTQEIEQLESQHERIAQMIAQLDGAELEAQGLLCQAIVGENDANAELQKAKSELRTIKGRRMGLMALLKRFA